MMELSDIERKLNKVDKKLEESSLAFEMLRELKKSGQRKFIIIVILIIALVGTNLAWLIRENSFETVMETEETTGQYIEHIESDNSQFTQTIN